LYLIRRPKGRIVGVMVYAQLLWWGPCDPWWGYQLVVRMTIHHVLCFCFLGHLRSYLGCITLFHHKFYDYARTSLDYCAHHWNAFWTTKIFWKIFENIWKWYLEKLIMEISVKKIANDLVAINELQKWKKSTQEL